MMHEKDAVLAASRELANMIVELQQQKHDGADKTLLCHRLDCITQQARMVLGEFDDENYGDC